MAEKAKTAIKETEREYVIPLRRSWKHVPRYKRANKAVKAVKEFLVRHMKIRDRDLNKVKLDKYLNEVVWQRGIRKPPIKIKVKAVKEGEIVRAELSEMPEALKFKKAREEKLEKKALEVVQKKKTLLERAKEAGKPEEKPKTEEEKKEETEKRKEEKEKKAAVVEAGKEQAKKAARREKHLAKAKSKQPKHQRRQALQK